MGVMADGGTKFKQVAHTFTELEAESSSLAMIETLAGLFGELSPEEGRQFAYLSRGKVTPDYEGTEFGLGSKLVLQAIARAGDQEADAAEERFNKLGDLGDVAAEAIERERGSGLTIENVFGRLTELARAEGSGSQDEKVSALADILSHCAAVEARYLVRIVLGTLRIGVGDMTFLNALSTSLVGDKTAKSKLEHAYNVWSDLGEVVARAKQDGITAVADAHPHVGVPVRMMLAQRVKELPDAAEKIGGAMVAEYKYDGERIQAHVLSGGDIALYSRRHEDITYQFPDVVRALRESFTGTDMIVEGEVVAVDRETGELKDFQQLAVRRRKHKVDEYIEKVPVCFFLFDVLYLNETSLLETPLTERREQLRQYITDTTGVAFSKYLTTEDTDEVESFFAEALSWGAEGIMVKDAASHYEAGSRGWNWIKFKRDYQTSLTDTFDLVVVGALWGRGRRSGTYGSLLVAAFDPDANQYQTFTKVGAGFTDEDLAALQDKLDQYRSEERHRLVATEAEADVWFEPAVVMEVAGAEITVSQMHTVGRDRVQNGGLALRFPRFLRWRDDKESQQATTANEVYQMYQQMA